MAAKTSANPNDFCLPDLGEGLEEAELIEWCVRPGETVEEFQVLAKMETAKALVEVPSPRAGTIAELHGKPGEQIKVGSPLVTFAAPGAASHDGNGAHRRGERSEPEQSERTGDDEREDAGTVVGQLTDLPGVLDEPGKVRAAPAVRRLARELGVDLVQVRGSGIGGRITLHDVEGAAGTARRGPVHPQDQDDEQEPRRRESDLLPAPQAAPTPQAPPAHAEPPQEADTTRIPFRGVRRTIAEHLRYSVSHAVHFNVMDEADVGQLDELRRRLMAASGEKISFLPFVAAAVVRVLQTGVGRRLNATVDDERQEIVQHRPVHLGIATDTESGLMVPVIRDAQTLGVMEIGRRISSLAKAARDRTIPREQLQGSTFTITNFGSYAGRFGTPIINYPEAAILGIGRVREGVVVHGGMIGVGKLMPLTLAADHRVVDGSTATLALAKVIELLQNPDQLLPPGR